MFTVYVLKSLRDNKHSIGYTANLARRFGEHNAGETKSTRWRRPFVVVYTEDAPDLDSAKRREKFFKSGVGRRQLKTILAVMPAADSPRGRSNACGTRA